MYEILQPQGNSTETDCECTISMIDIARIYVLSLWGGMKKPLLGSLDVTKLDCPPEETTSSFKSSNTKLKCKSNIFLTSEELLL